MTKQEMTRDIQHFVGHAMPTISDIARYLGSSRETARDVVNGLKYYNAGRAKKYYAADVAERILSKSEM